MQYKSSILRFATYKNGTDATVKSNTAPTDTTKMWLDTSVTPNILKYYDGYGWVMANDQMNDINDAVDNMKITITTEYEAKIKETGDSISNSVTEIEKRVSENETTISTMNTTLTTNSSGIEALKTFQQKITDEKTGAVMLTDIQQWLNWDGDYLKMGASLDSFRMWLSRIGLTFYEGEEAVSWFTNKEVWNMVVQAVKSISVGDEDAEDRLSLVVEDDEENGYSFM